MSDRIAPSAGYTLSIRVTVRNTPGRLGALTTAIGEAGGDIGAIDLVEHRGDVLVRDVAVKCRDEVHGHDIVGAIHAVEGVDVRPQGVAPAVATAVRNVSTRT